MSVRRKKHLTLEIYLIEKKWVGRLRVKKVSILPSSSNKKKKILNYYGKANGQEYFEELYLRAGKNVYHLSIFHISSILVSYHTSRV